MLKKQNEILANVKPHKFFRFLWIPLLKICDFDTTSVTFNLLKEYQRKHFILKFILFDLKMSLYDAYCVLPLFEHNFDNGDNMYGIRHTNPKWKEAYFEWVKSHKNNDNFIADMNKKFHKIIYRYNSGSEKNESYGRFLMKITARDNLIKNAKYRYFISKYRYDTPPAEQVHTYADFSHFSNGHLHIFNEFGKLDKSIDGYLCCGGHGLKRWHPEWQEICNHIQCVDCLEFFHYEIYETYLTRNNLSYEDINFTADFELKEEAKSDALQLDDSKKVQKKHLFNEKGEYILAENIKFHAAADIYENDHQCLKCSGLLYDPRAVNRKFWGEEMPTEDFDD